MLRSILVPLDGSAFGEQALPTAVRLAERDHAELELVHVYEVIPPYAVSGAPPLDPALDRSLRSNHAEYLHRLAEWLRPSTSATVRATVLDGPVAETLAEYAETHGADLLVMATHGHGGLSRLWFGSVASELVRRSSRPAVLIRPEEGGSRTQPARSFSRVLVPLDGSVQGEQAIDRAVEVAGRSGVTYLLLHVVMPYFYIAESVAAVYPDDDDARREEEYLDAVAARIRSRGLTVETRLMQAPQPARAILQCAEERGADLIAMETHARGGVSRLLLGSVAEKVVHASPVPVLLHRMLEKPPPPVDEEATERVESASATS